MNKPGSVPGFRPRFPIEWPDDSISEFLSDAAGNRISMTTSDDYDFTFIYDTTAGIPAVLMEYMYNTIPRLYVRTPDGRLIASCSISSGTAYLGSYYHFDGLGSTRALTNSEGTVTDRYTYDVWGNVTRTDGENMHPYLFVGQLGYYTHHSYYDKLNPFSTDSDKYVLLQLGVRYYQPGMGRFTQRDPIKEDGQSPYGYVEGQTLVAVDPSGLTKGDVPRGCLRDLEKRANELITPDKYGANFDKVKHCWISCEAIKTCNMDDITVGVLGWLKELWDCFTPGDASMDDIVADYIGNYLGKDPKSDCLKDCAKCIRKAFAKGK